MTFTPDFALKHVGIYTKDKEEMAKMADQFSQMFALPKNARQTETFCGNVTEFLLREVGPGEHGHLAISTACLEDAVAWLAERGVKTRPGTEIYTPEGKLRFVYLEPEFCGFAVHLALKD